MAKKESRKNSGYINFSIQPKNGSISVGGQVVTDDEKEWDLGFFRCRIETCDEALSMIGKQLKLALSGRGTPKENKT